MACNKIITIGRQFGSGGREVGQKLAEKLGIPFYDKELLKIAARDSGICELPLNHKVFLAAFDTIKSIAEKDGSCVFVGRCADYALRDYSNIVNAFIYADIDDRIKRIAQKYELTDAKAKDLIRKEDKSRASYYNYYTSKRWGEMKGYDICLNSSQFGIDNCVDMLYDAVTKY